MNWKFWKKDKREVVIPLDDEYYKCSKCGKHVTAGFNLNGKTYHIGCYPRK